MHHITAILCYHYRPNILKLMINGLFPSAETLQMHTVRNYGFELLEI